MGIEEMLRGLIKQVSEFILRSLKQHSYFHVSYVLYQVCAFVQQLKGLEFTNLKKPYA